MAAHATLTRAAVVQIHPLPPYTPLDEMDKSPPSQGGEYGFEPRREYHVILYPVRSKPPGAMANHHAIAPGGEKREKKE